MFTIQQEKGRFGSIFASATGRVTDAVRLVAILTIIGALISCSAAGLGADTDELSGTSWELKTLSGSELLTGSAWTMFHALPKPAREPARQPAPGLRLIPLPLNMSR